MNTFAFNNWALCIIIACIIPMHESRIITDTSQLQEYTTEKVDSLLQPNEILPIKPLLVYPLPRRSKLQHKNSRVIYIKLLTIERYHPKNAVSAESRSLGKFHIYYVKALVNGKFDDLHVKQYRLPEFYEIRIYHKPPVSNVS